MLKSLLIGLSAGSRSMTPLAAVSEAAHSGHLADDNKAARLLGHPLVAAGTKALAAGELWGDKLPSAPDRIVPLGIAARIITAGLTGAALAPRKRMLIGGAIAATAAVAAAYVTFHFRMKALRRFGQTRSGLVEDALTVGAAQLVTRALPQR
jgi:uncharacterized membrane protein